MDVQDSTRQWIIRLKSRKAIERKQAALFFGGLKTSDKVSVSVLLEALESDSEDVIFWSVVALGSLRRRSRKAIPAMVELLKHKRSVIRQAVAKALAEIAPEDTRVKQMLLGSLKDKNPFVRRQVLQELIQMKNLTPGDIAIIQAMKNDPNRQVADWAEIALRNIQLRKKK